jgi:hypothetical protein
VPPNNRKARDIDLLDTIDAFRREAFSAQVWRVVRDGRDPAIGSPSNSRWCNGAFDVLYTSLECDGAISEIHAFLSLQPVFPSKINWHCHALDVAIDKTLKLADMPTLRRLGVDVDRYQDQSYERTQDIADAACFLGFDGLIAPSARWSCLNLMLFTLRIAPERITVIEDQRTVVDWAAWRKNTRK